MLTVQISTAAVCQVTISGIIRNQVAVLTVSVVSCAASFPSFSLDLNHSYFYDCENSQNEKQLLVYGIITAGVLCFYFRKMSCCRLFMSLWV